MPQAVVGAALIAIGTSTAVGVAVANLLITIGLNLILGEAARALARRKQAVPLTQRELLIRGTVEPRVIAYGRVRTSGVLFFAATSGANNKFLHYFIALASCGPSRPQAATAITDVWLDDTRIEATAIGGGAAAGGLVTGGKFANKVTIDKYLGTLTQAADDLHLVKTSWTTAHQAKGIAYLHITLEADEDLFGNGPPSVMAALVEGRPVYDPAQDSTVPGGSGAQRLNDQSTWTFSTSPAAHALDLLLDPDLGPGEDPVFVDLETVLVARNTCAEQVTIPGGGSPAPTQTRYTNNLLLMSSDSHAANMERILSSMLGALVYTGGKWRLHAGEFNDPNGLMIDEDAILELTVTPTFPREQTYNYVTGVFYDPGSGYQASEFSPRTNAAFEADDGAQLTHYLELFGVDDEQRAQRMAEVVLRRGRDQLTVSLTASLRGVRVRVWDTFTFTGAHLPVQLVGPVFRCTGFSWAAPGTVQLVARVETPTAWGDDVIYVSPTAPSSDTPEIGLAAPSNLLATPVLGGVKLAWTASAPEPIGVKYDVWRVTPGSPGGFHAATRLVSILSTTFVDMRDDSLVFDYFLTARHPTLGSSTEVGPAQAAPIQPAEALPLGVAVSPTSVTESQAPGSPTLLTTDPVTATASGGVTPYTFEWQRVSGDAAIVVDSPASDTTTFSAALDIEDTLTGTFRCLVTSSRAGSPTEQAYSPLVSVTIERAVPPLEASASSTNVFKESSSSPVTSDAVVASATGGTAPYAFVWSQVSGDAITINSPSNASTTFTASMPAGGTRSGVFRCRVTDSAPGSPQQTDFTPDVTVTLQRTGGA